MLPRDPVIGALVMLSVSVREIIPLHVTEPELLMEHALAISILLVIAVEMVLVVDGVEIPVLANPSPEDLNVKYPLTVMLSVNHSELTV